MTSEISSFTWFARAVVISMLAGLVSACGSEEEHEAEIRPVRVVTVEQREAGQSVSLAGTVESQVQVDSPSASAGG